MSLIGVAQMLCQRQNFTLSAMLCLSALVLCALGCGGKPARVHGVVTLDGQPVTRGTVGFSPVGGGQKAVGVIDGNGNYDLRTNRESGLEVGEYAVTVSSRERGEVDENGGPPMPGKFLVPRRYSFSNTSGLRFEVQKGSNTINLELISDSEVSNRKSRSTRR